MPASVMVGRGEAKGMATKQKASRAITKKEYEDFESLLLSRRSWYLLSRLYTVDPTTMQVRRIVNGQVVVCGNQR